MTRRNRSTVLPADLVELPADPSQLPEKKRHELFYVLRLRDLWPDFPPGRIVPCERPDFLVRDGSAVVGIEVREYRRAKDPDGLHPSEQESLRWRVAQRASESWTTSDGPPLTVTIHFSDHCPMTKARVTDVASALVAAVQLRHPPPGTTVAIRRQHGAPYLLPPEVRLLHVLVASPDAPLARSHWSPIAACWVPTLGPSELQAEIDAKAARFPDYARATPSTILLVVVDGFKLASIGGLHESVASHVFSSPFARTVVLVDHDCVIELERRSS